MFKKSLTGPTLLEMSGNRCRLRWSTQHLLGVYSPEFGILGFFVGVGSRAARIGNLKIHLYRLHVQFTATLHRGDCISCNYGSGQDIGSYCNEGNGTAHSNVAARRLHHYTRGSCRSRVWIVPVAPSSINPLSAGSSLPDANPGEERGEHN